MRPHQVIGDAEPRQCSAITRDGQRCGNYRYDRGFCSPKHDPLWDRLQLGVHDLAVLKIALLAPRVELPPERSAETIIHRKRQTAYERNVRLEFYRLECERAPKLGWDKVMT
jgi:hypothetical protein